MFNVHNESIKSLLIYNICIISKHTAESIMTIHSIIMSKSTVQMSSNSIKSEQHNEQTLI